MTSLLAGPALILATALVASSATATALTNSCGDVNGVLVCCRSWVADQLKAGRPDGLVTEDTYEKLEKTLENRRRLARRLCEYFGPGSAFKGEDCLTDFGAPRCAGCANEGAFDEAKAQVVRAAADQLTSHLGAAKEAYGQLAEGAARATTSALEDGNPFENIGKVLEDYSGQLRAGADRVAVLKQNSGLAPTNADRAACVGGFGCQLATDPRSLFLNGNTFSGAHELAEAHCGQAQALASLETIVRVLTAMQQPATLPPGTTGTVRSARKSGLGWLVFGNAGPLITGMTLPGGNTPVMFLSSKGMISKPTVSTRREGLWTVMTIHGAAGGESQTVELVTAVPDRDGDAIGDDEDNCPDEKGDRSHEGCPAPADADGDGIPDLQDACPAESGHPSRKGCPPDGDADGVADANDRCPEKPGTVANGGCPAVAIARVNVAECGVLANQIGLEQVGEMRQRCGSATCVYAESGLADTRCSRLGRWSCSGSASDLSLHGERYASSSSRSPPPLYAQSGATGVKRVNPNFGWIERYCGFEHSYCCPTGLFPAADADAASAARTEEQLRAEEQRKLNARAQHQAKVAECSRGCNARYEQCLDRLEDAEQRCKSNCDYDDGQCRDSCTYKHNSLRPRLRCADAQGSCASDCEWR